MGLNDLKKVIEKLQDRITNHADYLQKEPRTRTLLVDPLLRELGWDVEDPNLVELEYEPESSKRMAADYILKNGKNQVAIVEAKPIGKTIEDLGVREQADKYASSAGAPFFILTNGVKWLLYKRIPTASLASLKPVVSFDIEHDEPYYCVSACVSMWLPNLSGSPMAAIEPAKKEADPFDDSPDKKKDEKPAAKKKIRQAATVLEVTMPTGEKIAHSNASDTFVEVIQKLGIQQVKNLNKMLSGFALISTANHLTLTQHEVNGYYLVTHSDTKTKKGLLEEIARDLGVTLKVEIVPKD